MQLAAVVSPSPLLPPLSFPSLSSPLKMHFSAFNVGQKRHYSDPTGLVRALTFGGNVLYKSLVSEKPWRLDMLGVWGAYHEREPM